MNFSHIRHNTEDDYCPNCEAKLKQTHPQLASWYRNKKAKYKNIHIAWAFRDAEVQERLFDEGKTKVHWPESKHNYTLGGEPYSKALDIFQIDEDGVARWSKDFYKLIDKENKEDRLPIQWGGNWTRFLGDLNHFELVPSESPCKAA